MLLLGERSFFHDNHGFNFTCTSCIMRYHPTEVTEILHIPQFFLVYHSLLCGWYLQGTLLNSSFIVNNSVFSEIKFDDGVISTLFP